MWFFEKYRRNTSKFQANELIHRSLFHWRREYVILNFDIEVKAFHEFHITLITNQCIKRGYGFIMAFSKKKTFKIFVPWNFHDHSVCYKISVLRDILHNFLVTDNGVGDHHQHNNHHQYQPLARHPTKVDSHKSVCVKPSSQLSSPSTPTSIIPSSNVCTSSSVTQPTSSAGLPTGKHCFFLSLSRILKYQKKISQPKKYLIQFEWYRSDSMAFVFLVKFHCF